MAAGKYFSTNEFRCKCCDNVKLDLVLLEKLDALREVVGKPIIVNSGYRCAKHNKDVGGSPTSQHMLGKAADIRVMDGSVSPKKLAALAERFKFAGIGIYSTFVHVDVRAGKQLRWIDKGAD